MFDFLERVRDNIREWSVRHARGPRAAFWLGAVSFAEASFFPVPPDVLLMAILVAGERAKWFFYSLVTTLSSVAGALFGYAIGFAFFAAFGERIIEWYGLEESVREVADLFAAYSFATVFFAAFTPIPFKVFTIVAGVFRIDLAVFVLASLLGRGIRFFALGYALKLYGGYIGNALYTYFNAITFFVLGVTVLVLFSTF